jgi:two-component system, LytTR family, response regulator
VKYSCIIVDDEPLAIEVIRAHLASLGMFQVEAECSNAIEALRALSEMKIDLMFLDIQMPGMKGTDLLKNLSNPPKVILTTAFRDYAIEGFDLNVLDYLLKPISYDRFIKAVDKFFAIVTLKSGDPKDEKFIYLNINKNVHKILINEIIFAESVKDYLTIHTVSGPIVAKHTISAFELMLPEEKFIRIHRSFIVAIEKIKSFNAHSIDIGSKELPIGQNYQSHVFQKLKYPSAK